MFAVSQVVSRLGKQEESKVTSQLEASLVCQMTDVCVKVGKGFSGSYQQYIVIMSQNITFITIIQFCGVFLENLKKSSIDDKISIVSLADQVWELMASMDWAKTTTRRDEKHLNFRIWCNLYQRFRPNTSPCMIFTGTTKRTRHKSEPRKPLEKNILATDLISVA